MNHYQFQIQDIDQVNSISRWAFSQQVYFHYPIRHQLLSIELDSLQHQEFMDLFGSVLVPVLA